VLAKDFSDDSSEKAIQRRREQYRQVRAHVQKEDGRLQAYGWSLPGASTKTPGQQAKHAGGVPVPVPVYCRPLAEASPHMKVWCASGVNLNGGYTKDGGCMVSDTFIIVFQLCFNILFISIYINHVSNDLYEELEKSSNYFTYMVRP
jgi:hypothetical protein